MYYQARRDTMKPDEQAALEAYLQDNLGTVRPRPEFVKDLQSRLRYSEPEEASSSNWMQLLLFGLVGLSSSVLIVLAGIKAVMALLVALGVLRQVKEHSQTEQSPAFPI